MKLSILLIGFTRTILFNIEKIKILFKDYDVDFFLYYSNEENKYDKYFNSENTYSLLYNKIQPKLILCENEIHYNETYPYLNSKRYWYKIHQLNNLKNNYSVIHKIKYDFTCVLRMDILPLEKNKISFNHFNNTTLYFPLIKNVINDEFFIGSTYIINKCCDLINPFDNYKNNFSNLIKKPVDIFKVHLVNKNIKYESFKLEYKLLLSLCNIIAISGDSGSGKTTLATKINNLINNDLLMYECDRYHKWERGNKKWNDFTHLDPKANYLCRMKEDIFNLKIGNDIYQVDYDHSNGKFTKPNNIKSKNNIILCGLHSLYKNNINKLIDLKIYIDTQDKLKKFWKIKRDINKRKYTVNDVLKKIKERKKDYIKYIDIQKKNADIIISHYTNDNIDLHNINSNNITNIYLNMFITEISFINLLHTFNIYFTYENCNIYEKKYIKLNFEFTYNNYIKNTINLLNDINKKSLLRFNISNNNNSHDNLIYSFIIYYLNK